MEERLREPLYSVILDSSSTAPPFDRIHEGIRRNLESYRDEARIMGVIEQVSRSTTSSATPATSATVCHRPRLPTPSGGCSATASPTSDWTL